MRARQARPPVTRACSGGIPSLVCVKVTFVPPSTGSNRTVKSLSGPASPAKW